MNSIASSMQNESAVIALGMFGTILALVGIVVLGAFSVTSVIYRVQRWA